MNHRFLKTSGHDVYLPAVRPFAQVGHGLVCLRYMLLLGVSFWAAVFAVQSQEVTLSGKAEEAKLLLKSHAMSFEFDAREELKALGWENRLTGRRGSFEGEELSLDVGEDPQNSVPVRFRVERVSKCAADEPRLSVELESTELPLGATVRYELDRTNAVMRKFVQIRNTGSSPVRVLNVRLGSYHCDADSEAGERGTPIYLDGERWIGLAHPAGFALIENGRVALRQHPGIKLGAGEEFACMEAVYGVAQQNEARNNFVSYIRNRSRRVARGHDRPYAILESFGGKPDGVWDVDEKYLLENLSRLGEAQKSSAAAFDFYSIEFWVDSKGDLTGFDPQRFARGFDPVRREIERLGLKPGLWIDSGGLPQWTIGENPTIKPCMTRADGGGEICRASEPVNSMYLAGFTHHIKSNGVRLLKFDNLGPGTQFPICSNPRHDHLPGPVYSLEAIHNGIIKFLAGLDRECPDVFLMLYWGYRSPWWLLHADTYFDAGLGIEAASPTDWPVPYARNGVIQKLDQAQWRTRETPWLGKDSLGVWLSKWPWNSCIGKSRWQDAMVMDICRGSMLAQIWTDTEWLTPPEQKQLAEFVALLKANPECFRNSWPVLGDPARREPYGYCGTDGRKAFVAIHNACWQDSIVDLNLGPQWKLPEGKTWSIYRWWPRPARIGGTFRKASVALRPYEVTLLELVPAGTSFSLNAAGEAEPATARFRQPTSKVAVRIQPAPPAPVRLEGWTVLEPSLAESKKGTPLRILKDHSILAGGTAVPDDMYTIRSATLSRKVTAILLEMLTDVTLPFNGPGRATNGNFQLCDFRVEAASAQNPEQRVPVSIKSARADFSQSSYGGWSVEAAIDGKLDTAWSIDPLEGRPHAAVFELDKPIEHGDGTILTIRLAQGERQHSVGRLRIWLTDTTPPVSLPPQYPLQDGSLIVKCKIPATGNGILVLWGGHNLDIATATLAAKPVKLTSVWSEQAYWRASWQAWRLQLEASTTSSELDLVVRARENGSFGAQWSAYLVPDAAD